MLRRFLSLFLAGAVVLTSTAVFADSVKTAPLAQSPDGKIALRLNVEPTLSYSVQYEGKEIVAPSKLGLKFRDAAPPEVLTIQKIETKRIHRTWSYPWGRQSRYLDSCVETTVRLAESAAPNRELTLQCRVYNDGVAIRYLIDEKTTGKKEYVLEEDRTEFNFPGDPTAWYTTYKGFKTSQEEFFSKSTLRAVKRDAVIGCPVVVRTSEQGPYVALTEADAKNWGGMFFKAGVSDGKQIGVRANIAPRLDGNGLARSEAPDASPWRLLIIVPRAIDLVDQTILMNVSTPADPKQDWSWVRPGCASWDWWSDSNRVMNTETIKGFIDLAASMGWRYTFVDDPWYAGDTKKMGDKSNNVLKAYDQIDMDEVLRYSKEKGVRLFLWLNWLDFDRQMDEAFALYEKWGIAGLKIDFMDREDQEMIQWYDKVVRKAAERKLLVDFHGSFKPNGYRRAYPNLITREGIRGNEYNKWSKLTPEHYCTLPYTRLMLGPGDFTPGAFLNRYYDGPLVEGRKTAQGIGTRSHELAVSLLYDSPVLCLCDCPEAYKDQPGLDFYRDLPTVWDESRGVEGEIGEYFSLLRRKGGDWYFGAITDSKPRTMPLSLSFLGSGRYEATVYADNAETEKDARALSVRKQVVSAADSMVVEMGREGGQVIVFKKIGETERPRRATRGGRSGPMRGLMRSR